MEAATFLVCKKGCDPQTCGLQVTRRICRGPIRHHIQRVLLPFRPTTEPHNRPV